LCWYFPTGNNLAGVDLWIEKWGSPGNVTVTIKTEADAVLREKPILHESITSN